jgi:hypothetical protein
VSNWNCYLVLAKSETTGPEHLTPPVQIDLLTLHSKREG